MLVLFYVKFIDNHEWVAEAHFRASNNNHAMQSRAHATQSLKKGKVFLEIICNKDTKKNCCLRVLCYFGFKLLAITQENGDNLALRGSLVSYSKVGAHDGGGLQGL